MTSSNAGPLSASMLHLLHRAGQVADELFTEEMHGSELTPRQYAVLRVLERLEAASQTEIVRETGIDRSTLADIVKRLVSRGLIARRRSKSDARAYSVRLTTEGHAALNSAGPASLRVESRILEMLPQSRRDEFVDSLSQLVRALGEADAQKPAGEALAEQH